MAYVSTTRRKGLSFDSLRDAYRRFQDEAGKRQVYRTTLRELSGLSDRDLADLGIARSEIRRIAWTAAHDADIRA